MAEIIEFDPSKAFNPESKNETGSVTLNIGGIVTPSPFRTIIPFYDSALSLPGLKDVTKHLHIIYNESSSDYFQEVNTKIALSLSIRLIGLKFIKSTQRAKHQRILINYFSQYYETYKTNPDYNSIMGFRLSDYLIFNKKNTVLPLLELLRFNPQLVFNDSIVRISIGLLSNMCLHDTQTYTRKAKEILKELGEVFIPDFRKQKVTDNRALLQFNYRPEILFLLVRLYMLVLKDYLKTRYAEDESVTKTEDISIAYEYIYKKKMPKKLFKGEENKAHAPIAIKFITEEYKTFFHKTYQLYYSLRKNWKKLIYIEISNTGSNKKIHSTLNYNLNKLRIEKPHLSSKIDQLYKELTDF